MYGSATSFFLFLLLRFPPPLCAFLWRFFLRMSVNRVEHPEIVVLNYVVKILPYAFMTDVLRVISRNVTFRIFYGVEFILVI